MADLLSPGIKVTRVDMSQITPTEGDSAAVFGGDFEKGPVGIHTLISSVQELRENYGLPNSRNYNGYYQVQNFLRYSGAIYVSRAADINGTPKLLEDLQYDKDAYNTDATSTEIEGVEFVRQDAQALTDVSFKDTDKFSVGQVLKFGDSAQEYVVKSLKRETIQIPNPDYKVYTKLEVKPLQASFFIDEFIRYTVVTDATDYTVEIDNPAIALLDKSKRTLKGLREGTATVTFKAQKEGAQETVVEMKIQVANQQETLLTVTPEVLEIVKGQTGIITVESEAETYSITVADAQIASVGQDKRTITALKEGSTTLEIKAKAEGKLETTKTVEVKVALGLTTNLSVLPDLTTVEVQEGQTQVFNVVSNGTISLTYKDTASNEFFTIDEANTSVVANKVGSGVLVIKAKAAGQNEAVKEITINIVAAPGIASELKVQGTKAVKIGTSENLAIDTKATSFEVLSLTPDLLTITNENNVYKVNGVKAGNGKVRFRTTDLAFNQEIIDVDIVVQNENLLEKATLTVSGRTPVLDSTTTESNLTITSNETTKATSNKPEIISIEDTGGVIKMKAVKDGSAGIVVETTSTTKTNVFSAWTTLVKDFLPLVTGEITEASFEGKAGTKVEFTPTLEEGATAEAVVKDAAVASITKEVNKFIISLKKEGTTSFDLTVSKADKRSIIISRDITVLAQFEPQFEKTINFNANGGSGTMESMKFTKGNQPVPAPTFTAPNNQVFDKWTVKQDGTGNAFYPNQVMVIGSDAELTFYAQWKAITPKPTSGDFMTLRFAESASSSKEFVEYPKLGEFTMPNSPYTAPEGKKFSTWTYTDTSVKPEKKYNYTVGQKVNFTTKADIKLYPEYADIAELRILAPKDTTSPEMKVKVYGDKVVLPNPTFVPNDNKIFKEYNTVEDGTGTAYQPGVEYTYGGNNVMLYAIFQDIQ